MYIYCVVWVCLVPLVYGGIVVWYMYVDLAGTDAATLEILASILQYGALGFWNFWIYQWWFGCWIANLRDRSQLFKKEETLKGAVRSVLKE